MKLFVIGEAMNSMTSSNARIACVMQNYLILLMCALVPSTSFSQTTLEYSSPPLVFSYPTEQNKESPKSLKVLLRTEVKLAAGKTYYFSSMQSARADTSPKLPYIQATADDGINSYDGKEDDFSIVLTTNSYGKIDTWRVFFWRGRAPNRIFGGTPQNGLYAVRASRNATYSEASQIIYTVAHESSSTYPRSKGILGSIFGESGSRRYSSFAYSKAGIWPGESPQTGDLSVVEAFSGCPTLDSLTSSQRNAIPLRSPSELRIFRLGIAPGGEDFLNYTTVLFDLPSIIDMQKRMQVISSLLTERLSYESARPTKNIYLGYFTEFKELVDKLAERAQVNPSEAAEIERQRSNLSLFADIAFRAASGEQAAIATGSDCFIKFGRSPYLVAIIELSKFRKAIVEEFNSTYRSNQAVVGDYAWNLKAASEALMAPSFDAAERLAGLVMQDKLTSGQRANGLAFDRQREEARSRAEAEALGRRLSAYCERLRKAEPLDQNGNQSYGWSDWNLRLLAICP